MRLYYDTKTAITEEGVSQPRLFRRFTISWREITEVKIYGATLQGAEIHLHCPRGTIVLTPYAYKNYEEVVAKVEVMVNRYAQKAGA